MVKPSRRKKVAQQAVADCGVSIRLACQSVGISEACYRYQPILDRENQEIESWLIKLTEKESDWGFGLCFNYLRNVQGFTWNQVIRCDNGLRFESSVFEQKLAL